MSLSPSKLGEARDCVRKFAWQVVDPLPYVQGEEAKLGELVHLVGENYHTRGAMPDQSPAGKIFLPALPFVPRPLTGKAEGKFEFRVGKLEFRGLIDLFCLWGDMPIKPQAYKGPWPDLPPEVPVVIDYKSIKGLNKDRMLKDEAEFLDDPQALIYAAKTLVQFKAERVLVWWIYLRREGRPKSQVQWAVLREPEIIAAFGRIIYPLGLQLEQIRAKKTSPLDLPANPDACLRYGPKWACPRVKQCNLSALEQLKGLDDMPRDLLAELEEDQPEAKEKQAPDKQAPDKQAPDKQAPDKQAPDKQEKAQKGINPKPLTEANRATDPGPVTGRDAPSYAEIGRVVRYLLGK